MRISETMPKAKGKRFAFGKNWKNYITKISPNDIENAKESLSNEFKDVKIKESSFLDIGCGSGLFSLCAYQLGFNKVTSFDYDKDSCIATQTLCSKYANNAKNWNVINGSILDQKFIKTLGQFEVVYSWGVLHHTGDMWGAISYAMQMVKPKGKLFIALYNNQGIISKYWKIVKLTYVSSPLIIKYLMTIVYSIYFSSFLFVADILRFKNPLKRYLTERRGMKFINDVIDWIGGYPFETAKPTEVIEFAKNKGFTLDKMNLVGIKHGCNEFVFTKE